MCKLVPRLLNGNMFVNRFAQMRHLLTLACHIILAKIF